MSRKLAFGVALTLMAAVCGPATTTGPAATGVATTAAPLGELDTLRARGTLIVAVRVEAPPANRTMGDPAHAQKRAFEVAIATLIAVAVLGPNAKVELRSVGGDRLAALDQGADVAMTVETPTSRDRALISVPYAANSVVLATKDGGAVRRLEDLAGKAVAAAMDELGARDLAQAFLQQRGVTATLDNYQGVNGAVSALDAEKAVAIVGDGIGVSVLAVERKLTVLSAVASRPYIIATRKNAPELGSAVDAALRAALAGGAVRDAATKAAFPYTAP